tara:strand:- start:2523 stop:3122 length:600 start_codon:yes stop_codon:yes gene_type:complete
MRHMKLKLNSKNKRLRRRITWQESGQTLHEVLIASSILAISISGFTSGIIRSNKITHLASLKKAAESVIANDLESTVKHRFYTFRCRQGPCSAATAQNDNSLMYYDREDSDDKQDFIGLCNARDLARELLSENENDITTGEQAINSNSLPNQDITITRTISLDEANNNQAIIEYEAELDSKVIATIQTTLVPNAVHWCS